MEDKNIKRMKTVWSSMKQRCYNPNNPSYFRYGGRGIKVCDRWLESFDNFYEDLGDRPSEDYSIDRIDNNGNYEPSNCIWATREEQAQNKEDYKLRRIIKKQKYMENLLVSGTTNDLKAWDIETIMQYETDNKIGPYCDGLTYLELEILNNQL